MTNDFIRDILIYGLVILGAFLLDFKKSKKYWYVLLLLFIIGFVDDSLNTITIAFPGTQLIKSHTWNNYLYCDWSSKIYSIAIALLLLIPLKKIISPDEVGLRFSQNKNSIKYSLLIISIFFVIASVIGILSRKGPFDSNTLLFLAIMPGLNEELIYRGFLLGLFNKIFDKKLKLSGTQFGYGAILTSVIFGLLHGFQLSDDYRFQFDLLAILTSGIYGFIYALIRERSGSLVFPVIAHGTVDFFNFFFRMI